MSEAIERARGYWRRGWMPVEIAEGQKGPRRRGWQDTRWTDESEMIAAFEATRAGNVGVLMGEPSGWLVDVDLDCGEAVRLAVEFLPRTAMYGRHSNPSSHYLYVADGAETRKYLDPNRKKDKMIVEVRSTGTQSLMPGSLNPGKIKNAKREDCELVEWENDEDPVIVGRAELEAACGKIAAGVLLIRSGAGIRDVLRILGDVSRYDSEIPAAAREWLGLDSGLDLPKRRDLNRGSSGGIYSGGMDDLIEAAARYVDAHPMDYPAQGRECPVCGSAASWKALPGSDGRKWYCWSTRHDAYGVGGRGAAGGWVGDVLDIEAHRASMTRAGLLKATGYLGASNGKGSGKGSGNTGELPEKDPEIPGSSGADTGESTDRLYEISEKSADYPLPDVGPLDELAEEIRAADGKVARARVVADFLRDGDRWDALVAAATNDPVSVDAGFVAIGAVDGAGALAKRIERRLKETIADVKAKKKRSELVVLGPDDEHGEPSSTLTAAGLRIPDGWALCDEGVYQEKVSAEGEISHTRVTRLPVMITGVLVDVDDELTTSAPVEHVCLEWRIGDGRWMHGVVKRSQVRDTRALVKLSDWGIDSGSHNARALVGWLAAQEGENAADLPRAHVAHRMGWMGEDGRLGFMLGASHVGLSGEIEDRRSRPRDWSAGHVQLDASDGYAQMAGGFRVSGDLDGWRRVVESVGEFPSPLLAVYASLAAPLVGVLEGAPNAILDWSGDTSRGKTSVLRLAASVWGLPDKRGGGLIGSWDTTQVGVERAASFFRDLPLILDDTKDCKHKEIISSVLYSYAGGAGRLRGSIDGVRASSSSRGILLSTGEQAITEYSQDAGARARVLQLSGSPFGRGDQRRLVEGIALGVSDHHGAAGLECIRWLLGERREERWGDLRDRYSDRREYWAETMIGSSVGARLAGTIALLDLGSMLCHTVLGVADPACSPLAYAVECASGVVEDTDRPRAALESIYAWACAHEADFWGRHQVLGAAMEPRIPSRGWAGAWDRAEDWDYLALIPDALTRILRHQGYEDTAGISASWAERGWIQVPASRGSRRTTKTRVGGSRVYCVRLDRRAFVEAGAIDE